MFINNSVIIINKKMIAKQFNREKKERSCLAAIEDNSTVQLCTVFHNRICLVLEINDKSIEINTFYFQKVISLHSLIMQC